jgi:hypothetical protein
METEFNWEGTIEDAWIETFSGVKINVFNPNPDHILIEDIAHALAMCTRFNGHLRYYYSVAEHCIHASLMCSEKNAMAALLHDASEAYLTDVPRPINQFLPAIKQIDDNLTTVILNKFGIYEIPDEVKRIDRGLCLREAEYSGMDVASWGEGHEQYGQLVNCFEPNHWDHIDAKRHFMSRYESLRRRNE